MSMEHALSNLLICSQHVSQHFEHLYHMRRIRSGRHTFLWIKAIVLVVGVIGHNNEGFPTGEIILMLVEGAGEVVHCVFVIG